MKKVLSILVFTCLALFSYSQSKTEFGLTTEGSWFMPQTIDRYSEPNRNGWGTGIGVYASRSIFWRFSADIGLGYRYKKMQQHYTIILEPMVVMVMAIVMALLMNQPILKDGKNTTFTMWLCPFICNY